MSRRLQLRTLDAHPESSARSFRAAIVGAELRSASFEGREHLVVPVVALVEGVIFASNAETPELVTADEFSKVPQGWNGRPVVWDHPELNGRKISANSPLVLEQMSFGKVFATKVENKSLKMEAWIDLSRAAKIPEAQKVVDRIRAGETVEVSVGAFVGSDEKKGVFQNKPYIGSWKDIVPDHLALLPQGTKGACNIEMGCGTPRAAEEHVELDEALLALEESAFLAALEEHELRDAAFDRKAYMKEYNARKKGLGKAKGGGGGDGASESPKGLGHLKGQTVGNANEKISGTRTVRDNGKEFQQVDVDISYAAGIGTVQSQTLLKKRHKLEKKGWAVEDHQKSGGKSGLPSRRIKFNSPHGMSPEKAAMDFKAAGEGDDTMSWWEKFKALGDHLRSATPMGEEPSDRDRRDRFDKMLFAEEPGFLNVLDVYETEVVFASADADGNTKRFKRPFEEDDEGNLKFGEKVEVEEVRSYEVKAASAGSCGCGGGHKSDPAPTTLTEEGQMKIDASRVKALIATGKTCFTAASESVLAQLPEAEFKALEDHVAALTKSEKEKEKADEAVRAAAAAAQPPAPKTLSQDEMLAQMPSVKAIVDAHNARAAARKAEIIGLITASAAHKDAFTADELAAKSTDELEKLVKFLGASAPVDNSGRGFPRALSEKAEDRPKTVDMTAKIKAAREKSA